MTCDIAFIPPRIPGGKYHRGGLSPSMKRKLRLGGTRCGLDAAGAECVLAEGQGCLARPSRDTCSRGSELPGTLPTRSLGPEAATDAGCLPHTPRPPSRSEPAARSCPTDRLPAQRRRAGCGCGGSLRDGRGRKGRAGHSVQREPPRLRHRGDTLRSPPDHQSLGARPRPHLRPSLRRLRHPESSSLAPGPPHVEQHSPHFPHESPFPAAPLGLLHPAGPPQQHSELHAAAGP